MVKLAGGVLMKRRPYNPDIGDQLRHELWRLKQRTGIPMAKHLRAALRQYLAQQQEVQP